MAKIYLNPIAVRTVNRRLKVYAVEERPLSKKGNKTTKVVDPNYDVLPALLDLCGAYLEKKENGLSIAQVSKGTIGSKVSLFGIFRALMVIKAINPVVYRMIVDVARYLSYAVDENYTVPPLTLLLEEGDPLIEKVWLKVHERTGITKEMYAREVARSFEEIGLLEHFGLFSAKKEDDQQEVAKLLERPVSLMPYSPRLYDSWKEDLEMLIEELRKEAQRYGK